MSAALIDLVSTGAQDVYITGDPQVSFFVKIINVIQTFRSNPSEWILLAPSVVVMKS